MEPPGPNPDSKEHRTGSGISLQTLIIASLASAAASFAASRIWGPGTLIGAAVTPVVVALVSEFLRRPVQRVATTAKKIPSAQTLPAIRKRTVAAPEDLPRVREDPTRVTGDPPTPEEPRTRSGPPEPRRRIEPPGVIPPVADPGRIKHAEVKGWRPRWRVAVGTGLVAFAIVVALYTVPDLLAGRSITGNGQPTTFFGGSANVKQRANPTTDTTTTPTTTVTKTTPTTTAAKTTTTPTTTTGATPTTRATTPTGTQTTTTPTTTAPPVP